MSQYLWDKIMKYYNIKVDFFFDICHMLAPTMPAAMYTTHIAQVWHKPFKNVSQGYTHTHTMKCKQL